MLLSVLLCSTVWLYGHAEEIDAKKPQWQILQQEFKSYIPQHYTLFAAVSGDLNGDGVDDMVLIVKGTDPKQWVDDQYRGRLDRNRRGLIVLLNQNGQYRPVLKNLDCFSSENEEGGVYFPPELLVEIDKGLLNIRYLHGRYGHWGYSFRLKGQDLALIGFEGSNNFGPYIRRQTSINFITQRELTRTNLNAAQDEVEPPRFAEKWSKVNYPSYYLSKIKDFDDFSFD
ncbi:hypothetical protein [Acinetobacter larvae]